MSNAGYGNHTEDRPGQPAETPGSPAETPGSGKPAGGKPDRPDANVGGAGDLSAAQGGTDSRPGRTESGPPASGDNHRHEATPGAGTLPSDAAGDEVDPAAG